MYLLFTSVFNVFRNSSVINLKSSHFLMRNCITLYLYAQIFWRKPKWFGRHTQARTCDCSHTGVNDSFAKQQQDANVCASIETKMTYTKYKWCSCWEIYWSGCFANSFCTYTNFSGNSNFLSGLSIFSSIQFQT